MFYLASWFIILTSSIINLATSTIHKPTSEELVPVIVNVLTHYVTHFDTDSASHYPPNNTLAFSFYSSSKPDSYLSMEYYLNRLMRYIHCSSESWIISLLYVDALCRKYQYLRLNSYSVHRLFLTSLLIATKSRDDVYYHNSYFANIGCITLPEMNHLEHVFLKMMDWELSVTYHQYQSFLMTVLEQFAPDKVDQWVDLSLFDDVPKVSESSDNKVKAVEPSRPLVD
eukprot:198227_1